jgi:hypothetical protein
MAGRIFTKALSRIEWPGGKAPTGALLSRLILKTSPETWQAVLDQFPKGRPFKSREQTTKTRKTGEGRSKLERRVPERVG